MLFYVLLATFTHCFYSILTDISGCFRENLWFLSKTLTCRLAQLETEPMTLQMKENSLYLATATNCKGNVHILSILEKNIMLSYSL